MSQTGVGNGNRLFVVVGCAQYAQIHAQVDDKAGFCVDCQAEHIFQWRIPQTI
jgi:hypothetical protein